MTRARCVMSKRVVPRSRCTAPTLTGPTDTPARRRATSDDGPTSTLETFARRAGPHPQAARPPPTPDRGLDGVRRRGCHAAPRRRSTSTRSRAPAQGAGRLGPGRAEHDEIERPDAALAQAGQHGVGPGVAGRRPARWRRRSRRQQLGPADLDHHRRGAAADVRRGRPARRPAAATAAGDHPAPAGAAPPTDQHRDGEQRRRRRRSPARPTRPSGAAAPTRATSDDPPQPEHGSAGGAPRPASRAPARRRGPPCTPTSSPGPRPARRAGWPAGRPPASGRRWARAAGPPRPGRRG